MFLDEVQLLEILCKNVIPFFGANNYETSGMYREKIAHQSFPQFVLNAAENERRTKFSET